MPELAGVLKPWNLPDCLLTCFSGATIVNSVAGDYHNSKDGMDCPVCGYAESKVIDSRTSDSQGAVRRRRECLQCGARFTTYERIEERPLLVIKRDGSSEPFDFNKLRRGVMTAVVKRPIGAEAIDALINDVVTNLQNSMRSEVSSKLLGDMVLLRLKELDGVAYVRFASVYKDFQNLDEFTRELEEL